MKKTLDWRLAEVVNIYDEVSLWAAPFGRLLLENIPMKNIRTVVDLGFGTGFPLIELAQRFGSNTKVIGVDIWEAAIERTKEKIETLGLQTIELLEQPAWEIELPAKSVDLVCSNLGVNNFDHKDAVYQKVNHMLKPNGHFAFTTNDSGTFNGLYEIFLLVLNEMNLNSSKLLDHIFSRPNVEELCSHIQQFGFKLIQHKQDQSSLRFVDAKAVFDHSLIRIAFMDSWRGAITRVHFESVIHRAKEVIDAEIKESGTFEMHIPMHYFDFRRR